MRLFRVFLLGALFSTVGISLGRPVLCAAQQPAAIDCTIRPLARIPPGTCIDNRPGGGFTHLIFKTRSRLATGDVDQLHEIARSLAEFLFTAMVARVGTYRDAGSAKYRIESVAIGVGTRIGQHDVIVTSQTQRQLGAGLGPLKAIVLARAEEHLGKISRMAASPQMWIVDAPSVISIAGTHRQIILRYLFLVEPHSGRLATVVWRIDLDAQGRYLQATGPAVWMRPHLITVSPLHVDGKKVYWGIPTNEAFAIVRLPPGTPINVPEQLRSLLASRPITPQIAWDLEWRFRSAIGLSGGVQRH